MVVRQEQQAVEVKIKIGMHVKVAIMPNHSINVEALFSVVLATAEYTRFTTL